MGDFERRTHIEAIAMLAEREARIAELEAENARLRELINQLDTYTCETDGASLRYYMEVSNAPREQIEYVDSIIRAELDRAVSEDNQGERNG